ncbi:MAG: di-heme oxidoredictase family protein [Phycisphaerales bacterium]|nr:di-heme oxidoredictase family protein [Phycisphaerales bacterium]
MSSVRRGANFGVALSMLGLVVVAFAAREGAPVEPQARSGEALHELDAQQQLRFDLGRIEFERTITIEDGLGPTFNQTSCASCHNNPVGGHGNQTVTRFGQLGKKGDFNPLTSLGGSLLQANAIDDACLETVPSQANVTSLRVTLGSLGFGLIEAISDADILAVRDGQDVPIRGLARTVQSLEDPGVDRIGRFGWKAQIATVLSFSADAAMNEMGLTNRLVSEENAPNGNTKLLELYDAVADPEDVADSEGMEFIDRVTDFQRFMAAPPQTPRSGMLGESLMVTIGCTGCHVAQFTTSTDSSLEAVLQGKVIRPYSDFLLHDMGLASDGIGDGPITGRYLRTPVLWGIRGRNPMWHDGRFADGTFEDRARDAIAEHDVFASQGRTSAQAFAALTSSQQDAILRFLGSLGRAEFDVTGDDLIDFDDFIGVEPSQWGFLDCWNLSGVLPDDPCAVHDIDQDGFIGLSDFESLLLAWDDDLGDCDDDGTLDLLELLEGTQQDVNEDGVPDDCVVCDGDIDEDGFVGVNDLLAVIADWGPCSGCVGDVNNDTMVNVDDLLMVIAAWGPCHASP